MKLLLVLASAALALTLAACVDDFSEGREYAGALVEEGAEIAQENCASCHAVGRTGESPNPKAPLFRSVLSRYKAGVLETELTEGMRIAHGPMPQVQFRPSAANALVAYLGSIQTTSPGQALAEQRCARCHAVGPQGVSPYPGAQPFRNLGRRWTRSRLASALAAGILAEHDAAEPRPPPMRLAPDEIEAFLAWLDAIATGENPAPPPP